MKSYKTIITGVLAGLVCLQVEAAPTISKWGLKSNAQPVYHVTPESTEHLLGVFEAGMFYGRLRSNSFYYAWEEEGGGQDTHFISALGGSMIFKGAKYSGVSPTLGLYYSRAFVDTDPDAIHSLKAGRGVMSRFDYVNTKRRSIGVLGEAYLRIDLAECSCLKVGRQRVETFYTKSSDTKMVPNTFDGVVVDSVLPRDMTVRLGYFVAQKLNDHTQAHSVLVYGDGNSSSALQPQWSENDDTAMHKGLTFTRLKRAGKDPDAPLIVGDVMGRITPDIKLATAFYMVPELLSQVMFQGDYALDFGSLTLTPGVRYIRQIDQGAGAIGGASYRGTLVDLKGAQGGYHRAESLHSQLLAARFVASAGRHRVNLGMSQVFDEGDLVTPWRGFPTAGYTRSMARYNWMANTKSYRLEWVMNANTTGVYEDTFIQLSALHTDADEGKGYFDEDFFYAGFVRNLHSVTNMQWRLRLGYADTEKKDSDSLDARFEVNYLF